MNLLFGLLLSRFTNPICDILQVIRNRGIPEPLDIKHLSEKIHATLGDEHRDAAHWLSGSIATAGALTWASVSCANCRKIQWSSTD
jgi:hypothetical protein